VSDELLSLEQCARKADVSVSTLKREIVAGRLVATRIRGRVKIHPRDWGEYLQQCRSVATDEASRFGSNTLGVGLAARLALTGTRRSSRGATATGSPIIELAEQRSIRSKKR